MYCYKENCKFYKPFGLKFGGKCKLLKPCFEVNHNGFLFCGSMQLNNKLEG